MPFHAADHVEGGFGFTAQRHFEEVVLDAGLDGLAELGGDFKEAVGRAKAFNALVGPLVIVVFDPQANALAGRLEALELGAGEELLPDGFPEALDLAQRHGMVGPGLEVVGPVLSHLRLETGDPPPVDIFPAVVGEHLLGRLVFTGGNPKHLQHVLGGVAAEEVRPHHEARVVVHEADQVGVTAAQPEGEDVRLPHLVRRGTLKETRPHQVAPGLGGRLNQALALEGLPDSLRTGLQKEDPLEQLGDPLDAPGGFLLLELEDLLADRLGQSRPGSARDAALETRFALEAVAAHPFVNSGTADAQFLGDQLLREALFEVEFDRAQAFLKGARRIFSRRSPPRGGGVLLLLYWFMVLHVDTFLSLQCQPVSGLNLSHDMVASTLLDDGDIWEQSDRHPWQL